MDPKKKFFLFKQSKHFCSVPWNHVEIFSDGSVKTCAKGQIYGNLFTQDLATVVQNDWIKSLKSDLSADRAHSNCVECYNLSHGQDHKDLREHYNSLFKQLPGDYDDLSWFRLSGIDLHWDNTCNLKCVYCNPAQSSSIAHEQQIQIQRPRDAQLDQVVEIILANQWKIKEIYLSGGEPMLSKHNRKLLTRLQNKDVPIRINSNITQVSAGQEFFELIKQFNNVIWTVSVEATGYRFEYIRHGSVWEQFLDNLDQLAQLKHSLRINSVWFIASIASMIKTLSFLIERYGIKDITVNQLCQHPAMLVRNAPDHLKKQAGQELDAFLASGKVASGSNSWYNIQRCHRELAIPAEDLHGYKEYFNDLDQLRGTNWQLAFPELI